jgi:hypothetical protein
MSTQSLISRRQSSKRLLTTFSLLGWLLIIWLALSSTAFAAQLSGPTPSLLRAGVSLVRLLVTYKKSENSGIVYCTGLGVIVASWPARNASDQNNWVLTDSSLVNSKQALCANGHPQATLTNIEVYLSTAYNNAQEATFSSAGSVTCQDENCNSGLALFALGNSARNQLLPFIDLAQQQTSDQDMAVALTTSAGVPSTPRLSTQPLLPISSIDASNTPEASVFQIQVDNFRTPSAVLPTERLEAGTPLINSSGQLTGLHLEVPFASENVQNFIKKTILDFNSHSSNTVHDGWQHGMDASNKGDFQTAHAQFQMAFTANTSFQAAKLLADSSNTSSGNGQSNPTNMITIAGTSLALWQLVIVIIALLAVLLLAITLLRTQHQRTLKADLHEAHRRARIDAPHIAEMEHAKAQEIAEMEAAQRAKTQQSLSAQPTQPSSVLMPAQPAITHLPCPRCGELVPNEANFCSNCRQASTSRGNQ